MGEAIRKDEDRGVSKQPPFRTLERERKVLRSTTSALTPTLSRQARNDNVELLKTKNDFDSGFNPGTANLSGPGLTGFGIARLTILQVRYLAIFLILGELGGGDSGMGGAWGADRLWRSHCPGVMTA